MVTVMRGVVLLACVVGALTGPINNWEWESTTQCATTCPQNSKFKYETGKTYEYQYESDVITSIPGAKTDKSSLSLSATVQLEVVSTCELVLGLSDVSLQDSSPSTNHKDHVERAWEFKKALQEKSLRFAFIDGKIEHVCPEDVEEPWVLNIKRGILSTLQNTMKTMDDGSKGRETDVAGDCPVEYEVVSSGWGVSKVKKTKDILGCTERNDHIVAFMASPYNTDSSLQSLPIMKSTHECEQEMNTKTGLMIKTSCVEKHIFRPFSSHDSGAMTEVSYKLTYFRTMDGIKSSVGSTVLRNSMVFDHTPSKEETNRNYRDALRTMNQLCYQSKQDIRPEVPHLFAQLVREMRMLDTQSLVAMHRTVTTDTICGKAMKFFSDALPLLRSTASIALARELITRGEITDMEADVWLTSIAFTTRPTKDMLRELKPLLETEHPYRKAALAISSVVNTYCKSNPGCSHDTEVREIVKIFEDTLKYNCRASNDDQHEKVLMALKAIGNTGHAEQTVPTLNRCMQNKAIPMEIRVAAAKAFHRMACTADSAELLGVFTTTDLDPELRINAYLSLMMCPTPELINRVTDVLEREEVNQVGSFVWTHLTNLMETSSPHKQQVKEILENEKLKKAFDMDLRKFSRNIEWSAFSDMINTGAIVESNLIWSTDSYVPRSAMVNLTADVFGQSINLLELGGRVEGLEHILESLFGPRKEVNNIREKRAAIRPDRLEAFDRTFDTKMSGTQASYYMKVFGNEIRYNDIHNFDMMKMKDSMNFLDWLIELAKEHDIDFTKSIMFLDTTLNIPTGVGMPLRMNIDGTTTIDVNIKGKMDIRQMFASPSTVDINGSIKPSAALEINCEMSVDATVAKTGLRMTSTLHTSTITDGKIEIRDSRVINLDLNVPQEKMEIFSAESKFFMTYREEEREQKMLTDGRIDKIKCIGGDMVQYIGVELCGEVSLPHAYKDEKAPWFPMTGPAKATVYMTKKDTHSGYHFEAKYIQQKNRQDGKLLITDIAKVSFNTPGSRIDRELTADFEMDRGEKTAKLDIKTPWKKAEVNGLVVNSETLKKINLRAMIDQRDEYLFNAEIAMEDKKYGAEYTPNVEIRRPRQDPISLTGNVFWRPSRKLDINLNLVNMFQEPVSLNGEVNVIDNKKSMKYDTQMELKSSLITGKVSGFIDNNKASGNSFASRMEVEYAYRGGRQQRVVLDNKVRDQSDSEGKKYSMDSAFTSTLWPRYNTELSMAYTQTMNELNMNFAAGFDDVRKIVLEETAKFDFQGPTKSLEAGAKFQFPYKNLDYEANVKHMHSPNEIQSFGSVKYSPRGTGEVEFNLKRESTSPLKANANARLQYPGRLWKMTETLEEKRPKEYYHNLNIKLQDDLPDINIDTVYKMKPRHELTTDITIPEVPRINIKGHLKPDLMDMQVHAEVNIARKNYGVDLNWAHSGNVNNFNTKADYEVNFLDRKIKSEMELTRKNAVFIYSGETLWDAARDESKKVSLNGQVTVSKEAPAINMKMEFYPKSFINIVGSGKYEPARGWYRTGEDMQAELKLTTSFRNFEMMGFNYNYDHGAKVLKSVGEVYWARNKKITTDFEIDNPSDWKNMRTALTVTTPFYGFRTMKTNIDYELKGTSLTTNANVEWESKKMTLTASGQLDMSRHFLNGQATFTSPFRGYEKISASARHTDNGRDFNTNLNLNWGVNQRVIATLQMHNEMPGGWSITNNGELSIETPIKTGKITWQHQNDASTIKSNVDLVLDQRDKISMNIEGSHKAYTRKRKIDVKASFTSPYRNFQNLRFELGHQNDRQSWENIKCEALVQWAPRQVMQFEQEFNFRPYELLSIEGKLSSPFRGFEVINYETKTQKAGNVYTNKQEVKWNSNSKITVDGEVTINGYEAAGQARFTSPFYRFERFIVNVDHKKDNGVWVSHGDFEYGQDGKKIEVDTKLGLDYTKSVGIEVKAPCPYIRSLSLLAEMRNMFKEMEAKVQFDNDYMRQLSLDASYDGSNVEDIKAQVNLRTPWRQLPYLRSVMSHKKTGPRFVTDGSIEFPGYRGTVSNDMTIRSPMNWQTKSEVEYIKGQKIALTSEFRQTNGKIVFTSPFEKLEEISLDFSHEGSLTNFRTTGELKYSPRDKITANVEFGMRGNSITGSARMTTPYYQVERVSLTFNHDGELTSFKNGGTFELNDKRFAVNTEFALDGTSMQSKLSVETPFRGFEKTSLNIDHNGRWDNFKNTVVMEYTRKRITATTEFALEGADVDAKFALSTPYSVIRSLNVNVNNKARKWSNFENTAVVELNGQRYTGESELRWYGRVFRGNAKLQIPDEYSLTMKHRGAWDDFSNNAIAVIGNKRISGSTMVKLDGNSLDSSVTIETPFPGYETIMAEVKHNGPWYDFSNSAMARLSNKRISGSSTFKKEASTVEGSATIQTPFRGFETIAAEVKHSGPWYNFNNDASIRVGNMRFQGTSTFSKSRDNMEGSATVQTPYRGYENIAAEFKHEGPWNNFNNNAEINLRNKRYTTATNFNLRGTNLEAALKVQTPYTDYEQMGVDVKHRGGWTDMENSASVYKNNQKISGSSTFRKMDNTIEGSASVETPFRGYERFTGEIKHGGNLNDFRSSASIETPFRVIPAATASVEHRGTLSDFATSGTVEYNRNTISGNASFKKSYRGFEASAGVQTPYRGMDNFGASVSHDGSLRRFKTTASVTTPIRNFESFKGELAHSGTLNNFKTTGSVETSVPRYEKMGFTINHNGEPSNVQTTAEVETTIPGFEKFEVNLDHTGDMRGFKTNTKINTPISGYEAFGMRVAHSGDLNNFKTSANINTPFRGYNRFGLNVNHNGDLSSFRTSGTVTTPFRGLRTMTANVNHRGSLKDFTSGAALEYNDKKYDGEVQYKQTAEWKDSDYEASMKLNTPYEALSNLEVAAGHDRRRDARSGKLEVSHNGVKQVDFNYEYTIVGRKTIRLTLAEPRPMEVLLTYDYKMPTSIDGDITVNWNTKTRGSSVSMEMSLKNSQDRYTTSREGSLKAKLPSRTVTVTGSYSVGQGQFKHRADLQWDRYDNKKIGYDVEVSRSGRGSQVVYDGAVNLRSAILNTGATFNHKVASGRYTTEVAIQTDEKLVIKNDITLASPTYKQTLTIQHPKFSRDASVDIEGTWDCTNKLWDGKVNVQFDRQNMGFSAKVADESRYNNKKYVAEMALTHPNSQMDFSWSGEVVDNTQVASFNSQVKYLTTRDRATKIAYVKAEINKLNAELNAELVSPIKTMKLSCRRTYTDAENGVHKYAIVGSVDGKTLRAEAGYNKMERNVEFKYFYGDENMLHMYAKYNGPTAFQMEAYRQHNGIRIQDAILSLDLQDENLVNGKAFVRPDIMTDLKTAFNNMNTFSGRRSNNYDELVRAVNQEMRYKKVYMSRAGGQLLDMLKLAMPWQEGKWTEITNAYSNMYRRNEFYVRTIQDYATKTYNDLSRQMRYKMAIMKRKYGSMYAEYSRAAGVVMNEWSDKLKQWQAVSKQQMEELARKAIFQLQVFRRYLAQEWQKISPYVSSATQKYNNMVSGVRDVVQKVRYNERLQAVMDKVKGVIPSEKLNRWKEGVKERTSVIVEKANEWYYMVKDVVSEVMRRPEMQTAKNWIIEHIKHTKWAYTYFEVEGKVKAAMNELYDGGYKAIKAKLYDLSDKYMHFDKSKWTTWDPKDGKFSFDLFVPVPMKDLQSLPKVRIDLTEYYAKVKEFIDSYMPKGDWNVRDTFYKYKPSMDIFNWIPPFKSHALIAGNQHYMTFDKTFYEFAGECSYMLARDFIDGNFSVVVNYEESGKKSLSVFSNNKQIEIFPDGKITLDGVSKELPLQFFNTTIKRDNNMLHIDNSKGLHVACDLPHDHCSVSVSGWYFAKTGGLFGTYNNEPSDDLMSADKTISTNVAEFADSWTVGKRCRPNNKAIDLDASADSRRYRMCSKFFKDSNSPFRPCFKVVDPEHFLQMCMNDMPINVNKIVTEEDLCRVSSVYVSECKNEGVHMKLPSTCVRCDMPNKRHFFEGENMTLSTAADVPMAADIVIVLQHNPCSTDTLEELKEIIDDISKAFKGAGMKDIRFAVVGFGGRGIFSMPHTHTMEGLIFNTRQNVLLGLNDFELEAGDNDDVLAAIDFAAKLPFRVGVSKSIILSPCDTCMEKSVSYTEIQQLLFSRDVRLHVLLEHNFELKRSKSPKTAYIFGADNNGVYTRKHVSDKKLRGDTGLRRQLQMPKELCAALAEETDGSVFNVLQWTQSRRATKKRFIDVFVRLVAKKATPTECQICECVADEVGVGMSICRSCVPRLPIVDLLPYYQSINENVADDLNFNMDYEEVQQRKKDRSNNRRQKKKPSS